PAGRAGRRHDRTIPACLIPGMDGLELARRIACDVPPRCPMILLPSFADRTVAAEAHAAGIVRCTSKPIRRWRLLAECRLALGLDAPPPAERKPAAATPTLPAAGGGWDPSAVRLLPARDNPVHPQPLRRAPHP